ncbi:uncharacterized protein LOC126756124 isoform X1 [Bactrocera neohumeralis]|uniref:uncharacterized protein LOC120771273 isoform X1 n=1 Tax=Bactrocera tryoni TaxID=59916 RepID=UPI001A96EA9C|nr:uncharacterized protein LOC120771273 isoform X1 [Bactrocera tryoni]XP_050324925.1 uncharacterized protein LOC126756124 isoform X1 [Bactrocera neohumeralis]
MSMLGFVYLFLILGWILIVLFLKCKKSITPHLAFTEHYTDAIAAGRRPSVHIIELPPDEMDNEEQFLDSYHQQSNSLRRHSNRSQRSALPDERTIETTYPTDAVVNPAYMHDEEYIINDNSTQHAQTQVNSRVETPPPSYEEVMRQPEVYPKVHQSVSKVSDANI